MNYDNFFINALDVLKQEGRYRIFNDIKRELNYSQNLKIGYIHLPNHAIILKEDYNQIPSKDIFTSTKNNPSIIQ